MTIDLAGNWSFQLDPADQGVGERWFLRTLPDTIHLPGSLQAQGYGEEIRLDTAWVGNIVDQSYFTDAKYEPYRQPGHIKVPFWLQPEKHYNGVAWYQREVEVPAEWRGRRVTLTLERPHWETTVWLDDQLIGAQNSLSVPHLYELGANVAAGSHRVTIRVDNRMIVDVGQNANSVTDHAQTNWNGIVGRVALAAASPLWMRAVRVFPDVARRTATVKIDVASVLGASGRGVVTVRAERFNVPGLHTPPAVGADFGFSAEGGLSGLDFSAGGGHLDVELPLGADAQTWSEFNPALYALTIDLDVVVDGVHHGEQRVVNFGLREVGVQGTQLAINGQPIFLRGTLECCIFPLTGYPPTDVAAWKRIIRICKEHGLNHIRFHSWCPPEAAFVAADELGFYYQVECPSWANQGAAIGEGRSLDQWLYEEAARITTLYGNHPSFIMMAYGNEPAGRLVEFLGEWVTYWRKRDPRRLYTSGAGWPMLPENQYHNTFEPRVQLWGAELASRINALPPETVTDYRDFVAAKGIPVVSHEIGQWCVYPNFAEIEKYTGVLKAHNFEIFRDLLDANHMGDQAAAFVMASGKLQTLCYKEEIESALRTPGFAGFHLLDLHDYPGQGTALVGVLDPFWDEKGYVSAAEFSRFCNHTVPLARMAKRYWRTSETFTADLQITHFGPAPLVDAIVDWKLVDASGAVAGTGTLAPVTVPVSSQDVVGAISCALAACTPAQKYTLVAGVTANDGARYENDWDIWVFADALPVQVPADILVVKELDATAQQQLSRGGTVLLMPAAIEVDSASQIGFSSVFWNTAWTRGQAPHTLGILCDPRHPLFAHFPTEAHSNWQWWELIHGSAALTLDGLPPALRPLVQPIDTWFEARRLGLLFEAQVGGGKLMVCSMDLHSDLEHRLVARQMLVSLLAYLQSADFAPRIEAGVEVITALLRKG